MEKSILLAIFAICTSSFAFKNSAPNQDLETTSGIIILDNEKPINSLKELTTILKGKKLYVDIWATWCTPCKDEFKYKDSIHHFLKSRNIEMVYINSDRNIEEYKLFEFIKSYDLKGYHLRLNNDLGVDLTRKEMLTNMIPQFMIINEKGEVVANDALNPSDGERLYRQLDNLLSE